MDRHDFERTVLAETRDRLAEGAFLTHQVTIGSTELARSEDSTDLVVEFTVIAGRQPGRYGWRASIWPVDLSPESVSMHVVSALVERVEAGNATFTGVEHGGVRWLTTSLNG